MPIEGLSQVRRLPRLGKIRMGIKVKNAAGIEHPQKTDYFVVPPEVAKIYGDKPKSLDIIIPVEDDDKWAAQYYKLYSMTQGCVCHGEGGGEDGNDCRRKFDVATGEIAHKDAKQVEWRPYTCMAERCPDYIAKDGCKPVMQLMFNLYNVPGLGIYEIDTSSKNSIININSCADYIRSIFGRVSRIPLKLTIGPKEVNLPETGRRQTVYVLNLNTDMTLLEMVAATRNFQAQLPQGQRVMLPLPDEEISPDELAVDGEEPPEVIKEDVKESLQSSAPPVSEVKPSEEEMYQIFESMESVARIKVDPDEVGMMINDLRKRKFVEVSRAGLTERFRNTYHVMPQEMEKAKSYKDMLDLLCNEHLKDFMTWLNGLYISDK